ncbi:hypothetical protein BD626DRAFT_403254 [Schizophyllum amplum]|uniref:Uncharacterized protein n=1 Tax=Schizophyllum amplum TaxID=97359 RepID=A0A550CDU7_9AGAR|nr:hypothetical protein BD626DRAFT_403254 [Auriculariopsis ampla]
MSTEEVSPYTHQLAIKLSQALNALEPNDLLAERVTEIAKNNTPEGFAKAARTFGLGKLKDSYLTELHAEILSHAKQEATGVAPQPVQGITVHDSDVLEPEPIRPGGLQRKETRHAFRQPPKPLEPPTPRTSILGLDRLAKEKRAAAALDDGQRKKPRLEDHGGFKGNLRQRGEETPSHPGGLNEVARKRLEEHRNMRARGGAAEGIKAANERREDEPRGLGDFQRRSNRDRGYGDRRRDQDRGRDYDRDRSQSRDGPNSRGWDSTPRRGSDAPSVRQSGWDETPRGGRDGYGWGGAKNRKWDAPTPRAVRGGEDAGSDDGEAPGIDAREWEEEQVRLDRDWYTGVEEGIAGDDEHNPLAQYEDLAILKQAEIASKQTKRVSARQAQYNADNDLWEANRMLTSGVATRRTIDLDFEDESESTVHVMTHDLKPPFLDGRTVYTKQLAPINPIRDLTSDMAVFSKKGSALVKEKREQAERAKAAAKLASLGGTALGNIMGVKDEEADAVGAYPASAHYYNGGHSRQPSFYPHSGRRAAREGGEGQGREGRLQGRLEVRVSSAAECRPE